MNREDQFLAIISPRRYFCNQCHIVQTNAQPHALEVPRQSAGTGDARMGPVQGQRLAGMPQTATTTPRWT
ncbi:nitrate reductase cytochrome c-type subunit [Pseudoxanthomonas mexicana]|uniref:nitrate reductase cytochrome c-type subunit n=1 Tax=Pseudoxanthomonas mexicana TaxID=128785 RepID=UPI00398AF42E